MVQDGVSGGSHRSTTRSGIPNPSLRIADHLLSLPLTPCARADNYSQVDRLWTFIPIWYSLWFALWPRLTGAVGGTLDQRQLLVLGLQLLWSARLTTNTYRRGFFNPCVNLPLLCARERGSSHPIPLAQ